MLRTSRLNQIDANTVAQEELEESFASASASASSLSLSLGAERTAIPLISMMTNRQQQQGSESEFDVPSMSGSWKFLESNKTMMNEEQTVIETKTLDKMETGDKKPSSKFSKKLVSTASKMIDSLLSRFGNLRGSSGLWM